MKVAIKIVFWVFVAVGLAKLTVLILQSIIASPQQQEVATMQPYNTIVLEPTPLIPSDDANEIMADTLSNHPAAWMGELWDATCAVESSGRAYAVNSAEGALGIVQIRKIYVADVNRILALRDDDKRYAHGEAFIPADAYQMWQIYCDYYASHYADEIAEIGMTKMEAWARIHNGGPKGWQRKATRAYWLRVRKAMEL